MFSILMGLDHYHMHAITTNSWFETTLDLKPLDYKPRILGPKIEAFPILNHKLSVIPASCHTNRSTIQTAVKKLGKKYTSRSL